MIECGQHLLAIEADVAIPVGVRVLVHHSSDGESVGIVRRDIGPHRVEQNLPADFQVRLCGAVE